MANQNKLKAWVRYDGTGTVVTAGPIFKASKPEVGNWKEMNADICCNGNNPSSTTTTTTHGGNTPTVRFGQVTNSGPSNLWQWNVCNGFGNSITLYTSTNVSPLPAGTYLYSNAALTTLIPYASGALSINGVVYEIVNGRTNPLSGSGALCQYITTTTTTTGQPFTSFTIGYGYGSTGEACFAGMTQTGYSTVPYDSLTNGSIIYANPALTQPITYPYVAILSNGKTFSCSNGVLSNQGMC